MKMHLSDRNMLRNIISEYGIRETIDVLGQIIDAMAGNAETKYEYTHLLYVAGELDQLADNIDGGM